MFDEGRDDTKDREMIEEEWCGEVEAEELMMMKL